jgi:DNA-binding NarL/FixJ family response regulator
LKQIRVLIAAMPRLLHEVVENVVSPQPDMILAGRAGPSESVATAARRVRADLVILRDSQEGAGGAPWQLLNENPRLKILAITSDGHRATRYELRPHQAVIDDIHPETLIEVIRAAVAGQAS